jgi:hypothetical protein
VRGAASPDPVGLHEVLAAAAAGERQRAEQQGETEFGHRDARLRDDLRDVAPRRGADRDDEQEQHRRDLEHLGALEGDVDDRGQRQDQADQDQHPDRDPARLPAEEIASVAELVAQPGQRLAK